MKLFGGRGAANKRVKRAKRAVDSDGAKRPKRRYSVVIFMVLLALFVSSFAIYKAFINSPYVLANNMFNNDYEKDMLSSGDSSRKRDYFTFAVCATDEGQMLTDSIMVISFDVENGRVNLMNVPRDTLSNVKRKVKKINGAYNGGIEGTKKELEMLLGIPIDRYIVVDFDGIAQIVDAMGGIEYDVPIRMKYDDPTQNLHIDIKPGVHKLNGCDTVNFLRWRKNNRGIKPAGYVNGDIGRVENQQEFIKMLIKKSFSIKNTVNINKMAKTIADNVKTDLDVGEMVWLGIQCFKIDTEAFNIDILPGYTIDGVSYYIPDKDGILSIVNEKFNPYKYDIRELDIISDDYIKRLGR